MMASKAELDPVDLEVINKFVDGLCKKMNEPLEEVEDFREEMTSNLVSSVREVMADGYSAREAVNTAIKRFGEPKDMERELEKLYRIKRVFAGGLLKTAIIFGVIGAMLVAFSAIWHGPVAGREIQGIVSVVRADIGNTENPITDKMKQEIKGKVGKSASIKAVRLQVRLKGQSNVGKPDYVYPENERLGPDGLFIPQKGKLMYTSVYGEGVPVPGTNQEINVEIRYNRAENIYGFGLYVLFGYWILFAVWASLNAFYNGDGILTWVLMFAVFNVLGYYMYLSITRNTKGVRT